jgi:hypothetical protein
LGIIIDRARRSGRYQNFTDFVADAAEVFRGGHKEISGDGLSGYSEILQYMKDLGHGKK